MIRKIPNRTDGRPTVGAAVVTHNGMRWIDECLNSVLNQSWALDRIVVIDDASTDGTVEHVRGKYKSKVQVLRAPTRDRSLPLTARIAANFTHAVRSCSTELVLLSDQDDRWLPERVEQQVHGIGSGAMLASDGYLIDHDGNRLDGRLRDAFEVAPEFHDWQAGQQFRYALTHSLATGGASIIRVAAFPSLDVPAGWLHDRWWSLVATALGMMRVDDSCVIEYRISPNQVIGLNRGLQAKHGVDRVASGLVRSSSIARLRALHQLRSWDGVAPDVARALRWPNLLPAVLGKK